MPPKGKAPAKGHKAGAKAPLKSTAKKTPPPGLSAGAKRFVGVQSKNFF